MFTQAGSVEIIVGPPGTGKTRRLMDIFSAELSAGTAPGAIAATTYSRAARAELQDRCRRDHGLHEEHLPWVRTIHSMAARLLGCTRNDYLSPKTLAEFGEAEGYHFTNWQRARTAERLESDAGEPTPTTEGDRMLSYYEWAQSRGLAPTAALQAMDEPPPDPDAWLDFCARFQSWKEERGLLDFGDILLRAVQAADIVPPVEVALLDEAHDSGPAMQRLMEQWFAGCRRVVVCADMDQCVHEWRGADPSWVRRLIEAHGFETLPQSYRVPRRVQAAAACVIRRNQNRIPQRWRAQDRLGEVRWGPREEGVSIAKAMAQAGVKTYLLYRNRRYLQPDAEGLLADGIPYAIEGRGGPAPLAAPALIQAVNVLRAFAEDKPVETGQLAAAIRDYVPVGPFLKRKRRGQDGGPGEKTWIVQALIAQPGQSTAVTAANFGLLGLINVVRETGATAVIGLGASPRALAYLADLERVHGRVPEPHLILTSWHGSKGREAPVVVCVPDMTRATWRGYCEGQTETENRVAYVAMTRAQEMLYLCEPSDACRGRAFEWPEPRDVEAVLTRLNHASPHGAPHA